MIEADSVLSTPRTDSSSGDRQFQTLTEAEGFLLHDPGRVMLVQSPVIAHVAFPQWFRWQAEGQPEEENDPEWRFVIEWMMKHMALFDGLNRISPSLSEPDDSTIKRSDNP